MFITDLETYEDIERGQVEYDKMKHVRWLVNDIKDACMKEWALSEFDTRYEMMI